MIYDVFQESAEPKLECMMYDITPVCEHVRASMHT